MAERREFDVLVVGAGPAGIVAADTAAVWGAIDHGPARLKVGVIDENPFPGGQIWREDLRNGPPTSHRLSLSLGQDLLTWLPSGRIVAVDGKRELLAETTSGNSHLRWRRLILATGARERFLPFPGWTLPGVMGAGGLQALVKGGWPIAGKRVVVAGSGPLLLAIAASLKKAGATVICVAEQAATAKVNAFALSLWRTPSKLRQGLGLRMSLWGVPYRTGCWPTEAYGDEKLQGVKLLDERGRRHDLPCDYLACGFGLVPNTELAHLLGCRLTNGFVEVDDLQRTSVPDIYAAGELTGIGGLDKSGAEGRIAGYVAVGKDQSAEWVLKNRKRPALAFAERLEETFALRPELKALAKSDTLVCRCEDVPYSALAGYASWRAAKLQTRCGMGPCQGRVCGPAAEFLFGWPPTSVRPPILPVRLETLCPGEAS